MLTIIPRRKNARCVAAGPRVLRSPMKVGIIDDADHYSIQRLRDPNNCSNNLVMSAGGFFV